MTRRLVAAAAVLALAVVAVVVVLLVGSGPSYEVKLRMRNASQLVKGNLVQVAGNARRQGHRASSWPTTASPSSPSPSTTTTRRCAAGTRAVIRQASLSGVANRYVDLQQGPDGRPGRSTSAPCCRRRRRESAVDLDQLFATFDPEDARAATRTVIEGFADATEGRTEEANAATQYLNPVLSASSRLFGELDRNDDELERFIVRTAQLVTDVDDRREDLAGIVQNFGTVSTALASRDTELADAIGRLPDFLRKSNTTFVNLRTHPRRPRPAGRRLRAGRARPAPAARRPAAVRPQRPADLPRPRPHAPPPGRRQRPRRAAAGPARGGAGDHRAGPGQRRACGRRRSTSLADSLEEGAPELAFFRPYAPDLTGWFDDFSTSGVYDANGAFSRAGLALSAFTFTPALGLVPVPPELRDDVLAAGAEIGRNNRCPGSIERGAIYKPTAGLQLRRDHRCRSGPMRRALLIGLRGRARRGRGDLRRWAPGTAPTGTTLQDRASTTPSGSSRARTSRSAAWPSGRSPTSTSTARTRARSSPSRSPKAGDGFAGLRDSADVHGQPAVADRRVLRRLPARRGGRAARRPARRSRSSRRTSPIPPDLVLNIMRQPDRASASRSSSPSSASASPPAATTSTRPSAARIPALKTHQRRAARCWPRKRQTLADLARESGQVLQVLGRRRDDVDGLRHRGRATPPSATAERRAEVAETFRRFPGFLDELEPTMRDLGTASRQLAPDPRRPARRRALRHRAARHAAAVRARVAARRRLARRRLARPAAPPSREAASLVEPPARRSARPAPEPAQEPAHHPRPPRRPRLRRRGGPGLPAAARATPASRRRCSTSSTSRWRSTSSTSAATRCKINLSAGECSELHRRRGRQRGPREVRALQPEPRAQPARHHHARPGPGDRRRRDDAATRAPAARRRRRRRAPPRARRRAGRRRPTAAPRRRPAETRCFGLAPVQDLVDSAAGADRPRHRSRRRRRRAAARASTGRPRRRPPRLPPRPMRRNSTSAGVSPTRCSSAP